MTLATCLNKFGKSFDTKEAESIKTRALEIQDTGVEADAAEYQAVTEHIKAIDTSLEDIATKVEGQGATVARAQQPKEEGNDLQSESTRDGAGRDQSGANTPLEGAPIIQGATGPDQAIVNVARQYAQDNGIEHGRQSSYAEVDVDRAERIAQAYEDMPHDPQDPAVREAYQNLIDQTIAQYRALEAAGYKFYLIDEANDPYEGNPWNAMRDLRASQSMGVFPSEDGFGGTEGDQNVDDNPLLADTGITWPYGSLDGEPRRVLANDIFRAVHDAFGHGLEGAGFRERGEENAWQAHMRLFTGSAIGAITSETRGQNSWLNFGPYGEKNRTAKVEDTEFAKQKTGLMPEWTWQEGVVETEATAVQLPEITESTTPDQVVAMFQQVMDTATSPADFLTRALALRMKIVGLPESNSRTKMLRATDDFYSIQEVIGHKLEGSVYLQAKIAILAALHQRAYREWDTARGTELEAEKDAIYEEAQKAEKAARKELEAYFAKPEATRDQHFDDMGRTGSIKLAQEQGYEGDNELEAVEWNRAVAKGLDMSLEARMERAEAMGFDTSQVWYHGTSKDFHEFDLKRSSENTGNDGHFGKGVYLTPDSREAAYYGDTIMPVMIKASNPFTYDSKHFDEVAEGFGYNKTPQDIDREWIASEVARKDSNAGNLARVMLENPDLTYEQKWDKFISEGGTYDSAIDLNDVSDWMLSDSAMPYSGDISAALGSVPENKVIKDYSQPPSIPYMTDLGNRGQGFSKALQALGYDSVQAGGETVVFDPKNIRSVNAAFDPDHADSPNLLAQTAFHGTPHKFSKFSLKAMGTGEGAQAYGWGLYFAGRREVAEWYKDKLESGQFHRANGEVFDPRQSLKNINVRATLNKTDGDIDAAIARANEVIASIPDTQGADYAAQDIKALEELKDSGGIVRPEGALYQVDIPEDSDLLDWDSELEDQPELVRKALAEIDPESYSPDGDDYDPSEHGDQTYHRLQSIAEGNYAHVNEKFEEAGYDIYSAEFGELPAPQLVSVMLNAFGVKGLRYLDGSSRDGDGTDQNYVIWDEDAVTVEAVNDEVVQAEEVKKTEVLNQRDFEKTKEEYEQRAELKPVNSFFVDVGTQKKIHVMRNPSDGDIKAITKESHEDYGRPAQGDPSLRFTYDEDGNVYRWAAGAAIHAHMEPVIAKIEGVELDQNANNKAPHKSVVRRALYDGEIVPAKVLAQYPDLVEEVSKVEGNRLAEENISVTIGSPDAAATLNQSQEQKNLVVAHNLSAENIIAAADLGGLAAPSIATIRSDVSDFDDFGEVSLLANPSLLESAKARTFDADVYSPRQPRATYEIDVAKFRELSEKLDPDNLGLTRPEIQNLSDARGPEDLQRSVAVKYHWLSEQGKAPKIKYKKPEPVIKKALKIFQSDDIAGYFELAKDAKFKKLVTKHYQDQLAIIEASDGARGERYSDFWFDESGEILPSVLIDMARKTDSFNRDKGFDAGALRHDIEKKFRVKKTRDQFDLWATDQFNDMVDGKKLFKGFTPSGNRRYSPYTMENVVREMTRELQGGEGSFYGAGSIRSTYANELKTIKKVQQNRDKIVSEEEMNQIKEDSSQIFEKVLDDLKPFYKFDADSFNYMNDAGAAIMQGRRGLAEAFDVTPEVLEIVTDFTEYLAALPSSYFETKIQRPVSFSEFNTAVVPRGMRKDAVQVLRDAGLKIKTYDPKGEGKTRQQVISEQKQVLFQAQRNDIGLYSQAEQAVVDMNHPQWKKPDGEANANEILAKLKKSSGVKMEELEWLGIEDYLQTKPKFTKDEVLAFIRQNGVQIEEVVGDQDQSEAEDIDFGSESQGEIDDDSDNWDHRATEHMDDFDENEDTSSWFDLDAWKQENIADIADIYLSSLPPEDADVVRQALVDEDHELVLSVISDAGYPDMEEDIRGLARDEAKEAADKIAKEEYMDNPYRTWEDEQTGIRIYGNDDIGYSISDPANYVSQQEAAWSFDEAVIQAQEYARDGEGYDSELSGGPKVAKWGKSVTEGAHDNYRELKLTLPEFDADYRNDLHFDDANLVAFLRVSDRELGSADTETSERGQPYQGYDADVDSYDFEDSAMPENIFLSRLGGSLVELRESDPEEAAELESWWSRLTPEQRERQAQQGASHAVANRGMNVNRDGTKKAFFVEEFQSDWHQTGREVGYKTGKDLTAESDENAKLTAKLYEIADRVDAAIAANEELSEKLKAVAPPFQPMAGSGGAMGALNRAFVAESVDELSESERLIFDYATESGDFKEFYAAKKRGQELGAMLKSEADGVPNAPFKGNSWINLGLKRAIISAAEDGYETFAWADGEVLVDRWSERYRTLYETLYDTKMPSMVGKLLKKYGGAKPVHKNLDGSPHTEGQQGYWEVELTAEMRASIREEGFALYQDQQDTPSRGDISISGEQRVIRLGEASDLSTFIHEAGHLFLEMEKQLAAEFGETEDQKALLKWLGIKSFAELDSNTPAGVEMHEKFAETFEVYTRTGKAPSIKLRDAFAAFARWLTRVYSAFGYNDPRLRRADLTEDMVGIFDRMIATQEEIDQAADNPIYDQFFRTAEQAGMTDEQFREYLEAQDKVKRKADVSLYDKVIKQINQRLTREWKDEKAPLVQAAREELSKQPVYEIYDNLKVEKLDTERVKEILGITKIGGRLIGKTSKESGVDPELVAEAYGYNTAKEMLTEILEMESLKKASEAIGEAKMIEKHGDILNDGTAADMAQEALHNEAMAELLLKELRALNKGKPAIDRDVLKANAKTFIGKLKYSEIKPNKYYRAEIKAAQRAVTETDPDLQKEAKIQQLANHYIYQEALKQKAKIEANRKFIRRAQTRKYDTKKVHPEYAQTMQKLALLYDARAGNLDAVSIITWYEGQIKENGEFVNLAMMDISLVKAMQMREEGKSAEYVQPKIGDLTAEEIQSVVDMLKHLRFIGGELADIAKAEFKADAEKLAKSIEEEGGKDAKVDRLDKKTGLTRYAADLAQTWHRLASLRNIVRHLDGYKEKGAAYDLLYRSVAMADDKKLELRGKLYDQYKALMGDMWKLGLSKATKTDETITKEDGKEWTLNAQGRFVLALNWGTESNRQAIMEGHGVTESDVMQMMSKLTTEQLEMVNKTWEVNETLWPDLQKASLEMLGAAPPKLENTPFEVNGVKMNGGYMRLFYDSVDTEMRDEANQGAEINMIAPTRAAATHARIGSGGRPVALEMGNLHVAWDDSIHYIAFAEVSRKIQGFVNNKDVKAAILKKHGEPFYKAMIETFQGVTSNRNEVEKSKGIAKMMNLSRRALTAKYLMYSVRNTVQQLASYPIAMSKVGTGAYLSAVTQIINNREMIADIQSKSQFMKNRSSLVNREAREYLKQMSEGGKAEHYWNLFSQYGFTPQTFFDSIIAFPAWQAAYDQAIADNQDEADAVITADVAVSESVGSGSNLHLGGIFQENNPAWIKMITLMGSWMNMMHQRMRTSTKGFTDFKSWEATRDVIVMPMAVAVISALLVMDIPEDEEDWFSWIMKTYGKFMGGTIPIVSEATSAMSGFSGESPTAGLTNIPQSVVQESIQLYEGKQGVGEFIVDLGADTMTSIVPIPSSGTWIRWGQYNQSFAEGNEGETYNIYQALTEGKNRND